MKLTNNTVKKLKKEFPIFRANPELIYLDSAATTQKPSQIISTTSRFYSEDYGNVHRGLYSLSEKATALYQKSREIVAEFIGAEPEEIIFTSGTTNSINGLSRSIKTLFGKGRKEIVLTEMEHHSNLIPWQQLVKGLGRNRGFKIKFIKINPETLALDMEDAKKKITEKTALVSLAWVSNALGAVNPIEEIISLAKEKRALVMIDAAQSITQIPTQVKVLDCDFLTFSGHKAFGPTGIGVLYGKKKLLEKMEPFAFGGEMVKDVSLQSATWASLPQKFEAGTPDIVGAIGLGKAIKFIQDLTVEEIGEWEKALGDYCIQKLSEIPGIEVYVPEKPSGIVSFNLNGIHSHDVASMLSQVNIAIRAGHHCTMPLMKALRLNERGGTCRASFSVYNTFEDIDRLAETLKKIKERFE